MIVQVTVYTVVLAAALVSALVVGLALEAYSARSPVAMAVLSTLGILIVVPTMFVVVHHPYVVAFGFGIGMYGIMKALYGKAKDNRSDIRQEG